MAVRLADAPLCSDQFAVHRQVGSLQEVLSQQAIDVLIGTSLPRTLRIAEVNVNACRYRQSSMIRKLLAPVPGQRFNIAHSVASSPAR